MTGPADLYKFKALLIPWNVRGLDDLGEALLTENDTTAWHDGDTCNVLVSQGMHGYWLGHLRCAGYNAPELKGDTYAAAVIARDYVASLVDVGQVVYLDSLAFTYDEQDNFGRMLGRVTLADGQDLATVMIDSGNAVVDNG